MKENEITDLDGLVSYIYANPLFRNFTISLSKNEYTREEIFQEFLARVCEHPERYIDMHQRGSFDYYAWLMIRSSATNKYSQLRRHEKYFDTSGVIPDVAEEIEEDTRRETAELLQAAENIVSELGWYDERIFHMYYKQGMTFRHITRVTKIPTTSVYRTVERMRELLQRKLGDRYARLKETRN